MPASFTGADAPSTLAGAGMGIVDADGDDDGRDDVDGDDDGRDDAVALGVGVAVPDGVDVLDADADADAHRKSPSSAEH